MENNKTTNLSFTCDNPYEKYRHFSIGPRRKSEPWLLIWQKYTYVYIRRCNWLIVLGIYKKKKQLKQIITQYKRTVFYNIVLPGPVAVHIHVGNYLKPNG